MATKVMDIGSMKVGSFIVIEGVACKVVDVTTSKSGKHGHAKTRLVATGLIDGRRKEIVAPSGDKVESPMIEKRAAQVLSVTGDKANVMDSESYETFDIEIPEEMKGQVSEGVSIVYWIILNDKVMKQIKSE